MNLCLFNTMQLDLDQKNIEKFVSLKSKNPKVKVQIAVGGWGEGLLFFSFDF